MKKKIRLVLSHKITQETPTKFRYDVDGIDRNSVMISPGGTTTCAGCTCTTCSCTA